LIGRGLERLRKAVDEMKPMIALTGMRRIGKTSVLKVFLNEVDVPYVLVDARSLPPNYGLRDLYSVFSSGMSRKGFVEGMRDVLKVVKGLKIAGFEVELSWRGRDAISLPVLFDYLNMKRVIIAVDEAQCFRGPRGRIFLDALAHAYDYDDNISFILTGSEVGLLYEYLGVDNPTSPLYGRSLEAIVLERFTRDQSIEFLKQGFKEVGLVVSTDYIESIVELFDGIPGWLTLAGSIVVSRGGEVKLDGLKSQAIEIARKELRELINVRGRRYALVLKLIAQGINRWSELKSKLEELEERTVPKSALHNILESLKNSA